MSDTNTITLKSDDESITFSIVSYEKKQLTVYNTEDDYLILFNKKDKTEKVEHKIPYDKYFKLITNDDSFRKYKFYFVWFPSNTYILTFKEDTFVDASRIGFWNDSTFTEIFVKIDSGEINYLVFNELNDNNIKGLVNGTIPFQFEEIITQPILDAKVLTTQPIFQENNFPNIFLMNNVKGKRKVRTISVGKAKLTLEKNGEGTYKYWEKYLHGEGGDFRVTGIYWKTSPDKKLLFVYDGIKEGNLIKYIDFFDVYTINKIDEDKWRLEKYRIAEFNNQSEDNDDGW